jgi:adenine-specific DNA-methyltransferase
VLMYEEKAASDVFGLTWAGKGEAWKEAASAADNSMFCEQGRAVKTLSLADNLLVEGDNLPALKLLLPTYTEKIGLIYIDPPYNTGNDFGYSDNYRQASKEVPKSNDNNGTAFNSANGRLHARWLSMMLPRLVLARQLLRDDGLICVSIDDNEVDKLRLLMGEIFGEKNFIGQITVLSNPRGRQAERHFATVHEYLLVYGKDAQRSAVSGTRLTEEQAKEFKRIDESGRHYRLLGLRQRGAASRQEDRPALHYPIYVDPDTRKVSITQDARFSQVAWPKKSNGHPGRWMWGKERLLAQMHAVEAKLIAHRNEWDVFIRDFLCDGEGNTRTRKLSTIWIDKELNYQNGKRELKALVGEAPVDYPKPVQLIKKAICLLDDPDAIVLDFFAGTGTTAQAVVELNQTQASRRRFILIQAAEPLKNSRRFQTISQLCFERTLQCCRNGQIQGKLRQLTIASKPVD